MIRSLMLIFLAIILTGLAQAQELPNTLNADEVLELVRRYHPVARQAAIANEKARANTQMARGAFDPVLNGYAARKDFKGTTYYNYVSPEIVIPTWYGIELQAGAEYLSGSRTDPTQTLGESNYLGVSVPLLRDLVLDKRRAALKQAKIFGTMAAAEQQVMVNDILLEAAEAYWQWTRAWQTFTIIRNNVEVNEKRAALVKRAYQLGERPAIDTVEAVVQLQSFQNLETAYAVEFRNAGLALSAYLWKNNNEPYVLPETVLPQEAWNAEATVADFPIPLPNLLETAAQNHPALRIYDAKLQSLTLERKLKFQELLPKADFQYNQLGSGYNVLESVPAGPLFENNFRYGVKVEMPLGLRQGRGAYKIAKLKLEETRLDQDMKRQQVAIKVNSYYNDLVALKEQITRQSAAYANYQRLVRAEETRFFSGESSLFLINSRETKALEALEKLIELKAKYYKTMYALQWSAGLLL